MLSITSLKALVHSRFTPITQTSRLSQPANLHQKLEKRDGSEANMEVTEHDRIHWLKTQINAGDQTDRGNLMRMFIVRALSRFSPR